MLINGLESKHYALLMDLPANKSTITDKITLFFNRVFFLFFKTHQWENNHRLTHRLCTEWKHLENSEKALKYRAIKTLAKSILACKNSSQDSKALNKLLQDLAIFKQKHFDLISKYKLEHAPSLQHVSSKELAAFSTQAKAGAKLLKNDVPNMGLQIFSTLLLTLPPVCSLAATIDMGEARYGYLLSTLDESNQIVFPIVSAHNDLKDCRETAQTWAKKAVQLNKSRIKGGKSRYTKFFFPFAAPGAIMHAVLGVVELGSEAQPKINITLIDPLGAGSGYRGLSTAFAKGLEKGFNSKNTFQSKIVFSRVTQQLDGRSCGYHLFFNIRDLLTQLEVQRFVEEKKLTIRPRKDIEAAVNELRPLFADLA